MDGRDDRACVEYYVDSRHDESLVPIVSPPLPRGVRDGFVRQVLALGGDGAYGRLRATEGTIADRLEAAAGMPVDSVIVSWRSGLLDAVGRPTSTSLPIALGAVLWAVLFSGLALRSTRWR